MQIREPGLRPQQIHMLKLRQNERNTEQLAALCNNLEDLSLFAYTTPNEQLQTELRAEINEIMDLCNKQNISVPKTLSKFFQLRDSNSVFEYILNLKNNIVVQGEAD